MALPLQKVLTLRHSRHAAMSTPLAQSDKISAVPSQLNRRHSQLLVLTSTQENNFVTYVIVLGEVCRAAWQFEVNRKVTISWAPNICRELYRTLLWIAEEPVPKNTSFEDSQVETGNDLDGKNICEMPHRCIPSCATAKKDRDEIRKII